MAFITEILGAGPITQVVNGDTVNIARYIANGHTIFNVVSAVVFLFFLPLLIKVAIKLSPKEEEPEDMYRLPNFGDRFIDSPIAALAKARSEVIRMSDMAIVTFKNTVGFMENRDSSTL